MNKFIIAVVVLVVLGVIGWMLGQNDRGKLTQDPSSQEVTSDPALQSNGIQHNTQLQAVAPYEGSGTAVRSFAEGKFSHLVIANIDDPAPGKFYEGWLVDKEPTLEFFSTGKLEKRGDRYVLNFSDDHYHSEFNVVVITEETESLGLDGIPETHVLEGGFPE